MKREIKILALFIVVIFVWMLFSIYSKMNVYFNIVGNICFMVMYGIHDKVHWKHKGQG